MLIRHGGIAHWVGTYDEQIEAEAAAIAKCEEFGMSTTRRNVRAAAMKTPSQDHDPEVWFRGNSLQRARVVALCNQSPRRKPCPEDALDNQVEYGVWGGLEENQRPQIRKPRKPRSVGRLPAPRTSEVRGVSWSTVHGVWLVMIRHKREAYRVGRFHDQAAAEAAAIAKCELRTTSVWRPFGPCWVSRAVA